jgi:hypothetical protein
MPEIRVLDNPSRSMQRLGYLKRLLRRVVAVSTSNQENLGQDLIETLTRKVKVPLTEERVTYIKQRLYDRTYKTLKEQAEAWLKNGNAAVSTVSMELQDLYLADPTLPSQVGKLVKTDKRHYPPLGITLGFIRAGTFSANTRALSLLHFTTEKEQQAFLEYNPEINPLRLSQPQAILFLYSLLENDGEVVASLWTRLYQSEASRFTDRDAGDLLPEIYRQISARHRTRLLPAEERERLSNLEQSAESIARWQGASYSGGGAREHASRVRVEPYADIGLLTKPDRFKYEYHFSSAGQVWAKALTFVETSEAIADFLANRFFSTTAQAWNMQGQVLSTPEDIVPHLYKAWQTIQSPGGYAPIEELALVAGINALLDQQLIIEPAVAHQALLTYQKANPYQIRFTVNRLGVLAHARFLEAPVVNSPV